MAGQSLPCAANSAVTGGFDQRARTQGRGVESGMSLRHVTDLPGRPAWRHAEGLHVVASWVAWNGRPVPQWRYELHGQRVAVKLSREYRAYGLQPAERDTGIHSSARSLRAAQNGRIVRADGPYYGGIWHRRHEPLLSRAR